MNWFLLFILFNTRYYISLVKISYTGGIEINIDAGKKEDNILWFSPKI